MIRPPKTREATATANTASMRPITAPATSTIGHRPVRACSDTPPDPRDWQISDDPICNAFGARGGAGVHAEASSVLWRLLRVSLGCEGGAGPLTSTIGGTVPLASPKEHDEPGSDRGGSDLGLRGGVRDLDDPCDPLSLPARNPANVLRALRDVRRPLVLSSQRAHLRVALDRVPHRCAGRGRGGVARVEGVESRGRRRDGPTPGRGGVLDRLRLPISWVLGAARATDDMDRLANQLDAGQKRLPNRMRPLCGLRMPPRSSSFLWGDGKAPLSRAFGYPRLPSISHRFPVHRGTDAGHRLEGLPKMSPSWAPSAQWRRASSTPDMHPPARQDVTPSRALVRHARRGSAGSLRDSPRPPGALPS